VGRRPEYVILEVHFKSRFPAIGLGNSDTCVRSGADWSVLAWKQSMMKAEQSGKLQAVGTDRRLNVSHLLVSSTLCHFSLIRVNQSPSAGAGPGGNAPI
jgi:hypothetical protein